MAFLRKCQSTKWLQSNVIGRVIEARSDYLADPTGYGRYFMEINRPLCSFCGMDRQPNPITLIGLVVKKGGLNRTNRRHATRPSHNALPHQPVLEGTGIRLAVRLSLANSNHNPSCRLAGNSERGNPPNLSQNVLRVSRATPESMQEMFRRN